MLVVEREGAVGVVEAVGGTAFGVGRHPAGQSGSGGLGGQIRRRSLSLVALQAGIEAGGGGLGRDGRRRQRVAGGQVRGARGTVAVLLVFGGRRRRGVVVGRGRAGRQAELAQGDFSQGRIRQGMDAEGRAVRGRGRGRLGVGVGVGVGVGGGSLAGAAGLGPLH